MKFFDCKNACDTSSQLFQFAIFFHIVVMGGIFGVIILYNWMVRNYPQRNFITIRI